MIIDSRNTAKTHCGNKKIDISINKNNLRNDCKNHCISVPQSAKHIYNICVRCGSNDCCKLLSWKYFEQWAVKKYEEFGGDDWLDFVMLIVSKRIDAERKQND